MGILTGMTLQPEFSVSSQPQNHTKEKEKGKEESEREKKNGHTHHFSVLSHPRSIVYKNPGRHIDAKIIDDNVRRFKHQKKKQKTKTT